MKEVHLFYDPNAAKQGTCELPLEESGHAVRVLRLREGSPIFITNGNGAFFEGKILSTTAKRCLYEVVNSWDDRRLWKGGIHLAVAPTKNMDRMEWLVEKATEIGFDSLTLLRCECSERKTIREDRLEKIVAGAIKQSHKAFKPAIHPMVSLKDFLSTPYPGQKFIAHCLEGSQGDEKERLSHVSKRNFLFDLVEREAQTLVLIGPEGDFTKEELCLATHAGYTSVSLGESRLRTETAALVAVHLMNLKKSS